MGLIQTIESVESHTQAAYAALQANGASLPEQRNLANLAGCVEGAFPGKTYRIVLQSEHGQVTINTDVLDSSLWNPASMFAAKCNQGSNSPFVATPVDYGLDTVSLTKNNFVEVALDFRGESASPYLLGGDYNHPFGNLKKVLVENCPNLNSWFCQGASEMESCELVNIGEIGGLAFARCYKLKYLEIPPEVTAIDIGFCMSCSTLQQVFIPEGVPAPRETSSLAMESSTAPAYINGIRLLGPGAAAWKAALPDRDTSPYRKLILGDS